MNVALVVVSDGRLEYLDACLQTVRQYLVSPVITHARLVSDSGVRGIHRRAEGFEVIDHPERRGLAAAVQSAWADLPGDIDFVFHLEEDFILTAPVEIELMAKTLEATPGLAQLVLKRQAWSVEERAAGGIIEMHPDQYTDRAGWVEHRRIFSLNPCLIPRPLVDLGWPATNEAGFTEQLVASGWRFGFWGARDDPPRCLHIGVHRSAGWMA